MELPIGHDCISDPLRPGYARCLIDRKKFVDISFADLERIVARHPTDSKILKDDERPYVIEIMAFGREVPGRDSR